MMIHKRVLVPHRLRHPPASGWSWIDRRFLREHAERLGHDAIVLYFFLAAVSDRQGLSYYGDASIAGRLRMSTSAVVGARDELVRFDLVAYREPLYQLLSLPDVGKRPSRPSSTAAQSLGDVLRGLGGGTSSGRAP